MSSVVLRQCRGGYLSSLQVNAATYGLSACFHLKPTCFQRWYSSAFVPLTSPIDTNTPPQGTKKAPKDVKVSFWA